MASSGKIRGITIEIGGDTSGLQNSLNKVNNEVKTTQASLKDVEKLLKFDPGNMDLLQQKQRLLNKSVEEYDTKFKALKGAQEDFAQAAVNGDAKAQASYDALQREIVSTELYLKDAKKAQEEFNITTEQVSAKLTDFSNKVQAAAEKTRGLSIAGAAVVGALGGLALKAATTGDELNTMAKQTGFSTEEIQKFSYASELVDVSLDSITQAMRQMTAKLKENEGAFSALGVTTRDASGNLKDSSEIFFDTLEALGSIRNETQRDVEAVKVFGESASNLAGIIDDGGASLRKYSDQAKIWSQESIDAANAVNDTLDQLKADIGQDLLIAGASALEAFKPLIEEIAKVLTGVFDMISNASPVTLGLIAAIAGMAAVISPILTLLAKISLASTTLLTMLPALTAAAPFVALAAAIGILVVAIANIVKQWDEVKESAHKCIDYIKTNFIDKFVEYWQGVKDRWNEFWNNMRDRAVENINTVIEWVNAGINAINSLIEKLNSSAIGQAFGFNIGTIGTIPGLAGGGVVSNGGTALVGENGAEFLSVNQGRATVTPLTNNTYNNTYNQTSAQPVQVTLMLDKTVLARELVQPSARAVSLAGGSCIK